MLSKTEEEISLIGESAMLVSKTLATLASIIRPGITTFDLDKCANEFIRDHGAAPSFFTFGGFPFHICTSVNDAVVHGFRITSLYRRATSYRWMSELIKTDSTEIRLIPS